MNEQQDVIGPWTEVKLDILREYAGPYSRIVAAHGFYHLYIDAYASGGTHRSRKTGELVKGSTRIALETTPPFREYHFVEKDPARVNQLSKYAAGRKDVYIHHGDCNDILPKKIFPRVQYEQKRRALCLLDPFNTDLSWQLVNTAGHMRSVEIFINFMVMDMNRNVLRRDPAKAAEKQIERMDRFWGDRSWREIAYQQSAQMALFHEPEEIKVEEANKKIAAAYRKRLIEVAKFAFVPEPLRFVNSTGATIYYLFFASPNRTGEKIVGQLFEKYRERQGL